MRLETPFEVRRVLQVGEDLDVKFEIVERVPGELLRAGNPDHPSLSHRRHPQDPPHRSSFGFRVERVPCGV